MDSLTKPDCNLSPIRISLQERTEIGQLGFFCRQIEFYFSDANLVYDNYMKRLIWKTRKGYVSLKAFCRFNKIKQAFQKFLIKPDQRITVLAQAILESRSLKLNKMMNQVKRKQRFNILHLTNPSSALSRKARTIYAEGIPTHFILENVYELFSSYGPIYRVELPRYLDGRNKSYCFVEYENEWSAVKAVNESSSVELAALTKVQLCNVKEIYTNLKEKAMRKCCLLPSLKRETTPVPLMLIHFSKDIGDITRNYMYATIQQIGVNIAVCSLNNKLGLSFAALIDLDKYDMLINYHFINNPLTSFIIKIVCISRHWLPTTPFTFPKQ